jgi:hypothetical protein
MLTLRDDLAGDAVTFDTALQEMRSCFKQKSGTFPCSVDDAVNQERFSELHKLLLGYRDLKGDEEQQEYSSACSCHFPPSVEQVATSLRWIEGARCLSVGKDAILPVEVSGKWQSEFHNMVNKLGLIKAREATLEEWKFANVEDIHFRLGQLLTAALSRGDFRHHCKDAIRAERGFGCQGGWAQQRRAECTRERRPPLA